MARQTKIWVYLTRRDKTGARFIAQFRGTEEIAPTRLKDVSELHLPSNYEQKMTEIIYAARLEWEPWIESNDTFDDLKIRIKKRGFTNLPLSFLPEIGSNNITLVPEVYTTSINKTKIMTRRGV